MPERSPPAKPPSSSRVTRLLALALLAAVFAVYANSLRTPFVLDDVDTLTHNASLRTLWPLSVPLSPPGGGMTVQGRPILNLSFALDYAVGGQDVLGYHLTNVVIHAGACLLLFGLLRRHLSQGMAFVSALLWAVHPLLTESVTYTVQRAESLMGCFYLMTLYAFVRATESSAARARLWAIGCVVACFLGMGTKEVMVSAPLMVAVYDGFFVSRSLGGLARRWGLYAGLAASWVLLGLLMARSGNRGSTVGFHVGVPLGAYAWSQVAAIGRYLRLAFLPTDLVIDYGTTWGGTWGAEFIPLLALAACLVGTAVALRRRMPAGFLGLFFFAVLAPTSLVPSSRQTIAEHRMYLALIPVSVLATVAVADLLRSWGWGKLRPLVAFLVAAALGAATWARNTEYGNARTLYASAIRARPGVPWNYLGRGNTYMDEGNHALAEADFRKALALDPAIASAYGNLGNALLRQGKITDAEAAYREEVHRAPNDSHAHGNLAGGLVAAGSLPEALAEFNRAIDEGSEDPGLYNDYGVALARSGQTGRAVDAFQHALRLGKDTRGTHANLGAALLADGRFEEAALQLGEAEALNPDRPLVHLYRAHALAGLNRLPEAKVEALKALALNPRMEAAREFLSELGGRGEDSKK